ncbi:MAG: hypothetical protein H0V24_06850 [Chloroflexia bacterium]|nr:hypothetical protein [Chloroflexia bacterium]
MARDPLISQDRAPLAVAAVSGLVAGVAYVAVQAVDIRLTGRKVDDLVALGRFATGDNQAARRLGLGLHLANSVVLALVYGKVQAKLPGPPWARGMLFTMAENSLLYPLMALEDKHPAIRDGSLDRYWNWPAFMQSIPRHLVYGAVLGVLDEKLRGRHW